MGGSQIETNAVSQSPVEIGGAVITTGGTLNANHVIHTADMGQDQRTDLDKVGAATRSTLALAHELTSLAFHAIRYRGRRTLPRNLCQSDDRRRCRLTDIEQDRVGARPLRPLRSGWL